MKLIGLWTFGMIFWVGACNHSNPDSAPRVEMKEGTKMESTESDSTIKTRIPSIDAATPAETRIATFALG